MSPGLWAGEQSCESLLLASVLQAASHAKPKRMGSKVWGGYQPLEGVMT